jgi:hypothetical protein
VKQYDSSPIRLHAMVLNYEQKRHYDYFVTSRPSETPIRSLVQWIRGSVYAGQLL